MKSFYKALIISSLGLALSLPAYGIPARYLLIAKVEQEPVMNYEEAKSFIEEEKKKLGIERKIDLQVTANDVLYRSSYGRTVAYCLRNDSNNVIAVAKKYLKKTILAHEVFHARKPCIVAAGATIEETLKNIHKDKKDKEKIITPFALSAWWLAMLEESLADTYVLTGFRF